ncbi:type I-C CRISPR-associated endonuclease Cas1c [Nocardiopsis sediminis]|uniref:CRISPR-associated endonuclease Cas1 n=1 Tax=Nocardiopsis sediminis TaxID=1778267 RepID=A0ABV8FP58_9ACTN
MTELLNTLYVQTPGASLHLDGDTVRVALPEGGPRRTLPLLRLESIVVMGNIQVSSQLLSRCADDGRPIVWMSLGGRYRGRLDGPVRGNVLLRHAQHLTHTDRAARLEIARACVAGKVQNSRQVILKGARDVTGQRKNDLRTLAVDLEASLTAASAAPDIDTLLGVEGAAARAYFEALAILVRADTGLVFPGRVRRPPTDPVNALLSFLYGMVRSMVQGACEQVGLDPYVGFLHGIRPGKPALALDMMEEFRPVIADRLALTLVNRRQIGPRHFEKLEGGAVQLTEEGRKEVLTQWQLHRQKEHNHRVLGRRIPLPLLPSVQARLMARRLRGDLPGYLPWTV